MQNPTIGGSIASMVEPCATADVARSTADLLRIVARSPGQQELILTRAGRFVETLDSGQLARLAMLREVEQIGRAHVGTPVTNAHLVCRLLLEKIKQKRQNN